MSRVRIDRRLIRTLALAALLAAVAAGIWQRYKPLPAGLAVATPLRAADDVRFLADLTWTDTAGRRHSEQQIFAAMLEMIGRARRLIVADLFLFNDYSGAQADVLRPLSGELADALIARKAAVPGLRVVVITDPINTVYGGMPNATLQRLRTAGIELRLTDLARLRASNPAWSGPWMLCCQWLGNDANGGWLPNALGEAPVTLRSYLRLLNFRANHRKTLVADQDDGWRALVTSMNPHDASSAHGNVALQFSGAAALDLIASEAAVPLEDGPLARLPSAAPPPDVPREEGLQILTESAIRDALVATVEATRAGDALDVAVFYFAHRALAEALIAAQRRGVALRVLLDPNEDAFGRKKGGVPNRPLAAELHAAGIPLRWCATHGEQCHAKFLLARHADGRSALILGSANYTRRNLDGLNLETSVRLQTATPDAAIASASAWFDQRWHNRADRRYSLAYPAYADSTRLDYLRYRLGEATGISTF